MSVGTSAVVAVGIGPSDEQRKIYWGIYVVEVSNLSWCSRKLLLCLPHSRSLVSKSNELLSLLSGGSGARLGQSVVS